MTFGELMSFFRSQAMEYAQKKKGTASKAYSQSCSNNYRSNERNWMASKTSLFVMFSLPASSARMTAIA
jgi:hypothetical protein